MIEYVHTASAHLRQRGCTCDGVKRAEVKSANGSQYLGAFFGWRVNSVVGPRASDVVHARARGRNRCASGADAQPCNYSEGAEDAYCHDGHSRLHVGTAAYSRDD
eukprot:7053875-Pyramimonas_sp.AAC.1